MSVLRRATAGRWRHLGLLNAQGLGLTVDAFGTGALTVDGLVERPVPVQRDAHQPARLDVDVFNAAFPFGKLLMLAGLAGGLGEGRGQR